MLMTEKVIRVKGLTEVTIDTTDRY